MYDLDLQVSKGNISEIHVPGIDEKKYLRWIINFLPFNEKKIGLIHDRKHSPHSKECLDRLCASQEESPYKLIWMWQKKK